jgi:hypothetical protein
MRGKAVLKPFRSPVPPKIHRGQAKFHRREIHNDILPHECFGTAETDFALLR